MAAHLHLASEIASRVHLRHRLPMAQEDLEAYARAGLVEAAERFDPGRGIPFASFAHYRITGALWDGVRRMGWQPRRRGQARFEQCANAYLEEAAAEHACGSRQLSRTLEERGGSLAVIYLAALDGAGEQIPDERETGALRKLERAQLSVGLKRTLERLSPRERRLLEGLYYEGRELQEVARELGISSPWACRLHRKAVEQLRGLLREGGLIS